VPDIWADHNHLQEVLLHLLQNAQHAIRETRSDGVLSISVKPTAAGVRIEVADDGPGIPPEHLPRIFNPFFTTKQPGDGRGLGLSVAHSIIAEHGGRIWAENRAGGGALFMIDLPIGEPEPAREPLRFESRRL
jgi:signal transduction histidine kinase